MRTALLASLILVCFGGMDALEYIIHNGWADGIAELQGRWGQGYIDWNYDWGSLRVEYQSTMRTLAWSPQHFISASLGTLLIIQLHRHRRLLAVIGVVLAVILFWSPFVTFGLLTLAAVLLFGNGIRPLLSGPNLLTAPLLAGVLALYLTSGDIDFQRGWLWQEYDSWQQLAMAVAPAYLTEFLILALLLWRARPGIVREPFFVVSLAYLLVTPWFYYVSRNINDFSLRSMLPALFVFCYYSAHLVAERLPELIGRFRWVVKNRGGNGINGIMAGWGKAIRSSGAFVLLLLTLAIGALPACYHLATAFAHAGFRPYEPNGFYLLLDQHHHRVLERITTDVPGLLQTLLRDNEVAAEDKGELVISSAYNVYLKDNQLVYVNPWCLSEGQADQGRAKHEQRFFFLHVYPVSKNDLSADRRQYGFDNLDFRFYPSFALGEGICSTVRRLPDYEIASIRTGEYIDGEGRLWEAEYRFEDKGELVISSAYNVYNVYLKDNRLVYVNPWCNCRWCDDEGLADKNWAEQRFFFLHVYPASKNDLPADRRQHGFDNLDFRFHPSFAWDEGICFTAQRLPDYEIASIRTGEYIDGEGRLWEAEYRFEDKGDLIINSTYNVYLKDNRLVYVNRWCPSEGRADQGRAEPEQRFFFLHVYPASKNDLPADRRQHGFDNLDFRPHRSFALGEGKCSTVRKLPDYEIASIRTGEYIRGEGRLWEAEYRFDE